MGSCKGADDCYVDGEAATETPDLDGDIAGSSAGAVAFPENSELLHFGREEADFGEFEHQVPQTVVSRDPISRLLAAEGVVAINIHGLLAKRAGGRVREHRVSEEAGHGGAKDLWGKDGVIAVDPGRAGRQPCVGVRGI